MNGYRKPHGQYVRNTADWFLLQRMAGDGYQPATAAKYATVQLYNNAVDGSCLHIVGVTGGSATLTAILNTYVFQGILGIQFAQQPIGLTPLTHLRAGQVYVSAQTSIINTTSIWTFGNSNGLTIWPYDWPLYILTPGYSLVFQANAVNTDCLVNFHWLVMAANEGYY